MDIPSPLRQMGSRSIAVAASVLVILLLGPIGASAQVPYAIYGVVPDASCCAGAGGCTAHGSALRAESARTARATGTRNRTRPKPCDSGRFYVVARACTERAHRLPMPLPPAVAGRTRRTA
jgi:hypothetical protein